MEFNFTKTFTDIKDRITKGVEEMDIGKRLEIVKARLENLRGNASTKMIAGEEALIKELERLKKEEDKKKEGAA